MHSVSVSWKSWRLWKRTPVSSRILDERKPVGLKPFLSTVHPQPSHSTLGTFSTSEDHSVRHSSHSVFRDIACTVTQNSMIISAIRTPSAGDRFTRFFLAAKNLYNGQKPLLHDRRAIPFHSITLFPAHAIFQWLTTCVKPYAGLQAGGLWLGLPPALQKQ